MNIRTPLIVSAVIVAAMTALSLWAWTQLPDGTPIAIHWNADGQPNGFVRAPLGLFMAPAMTALIAAIFAAIPSIEPRRLNLARSVKFYRAIWIAVIALLAFTHGIGLYAALHGGVRPGNLVLGAVSLLILVTGNYLGKTRSMFLGGIRTPWTLTSEYSWQRTHSIAGKLFVVAGAIGFVAAIALPSDAASHVFLTTLAIAVVLSVVLSFYFWRRDPERHTGDGVPE